MNTNIERIIELNKLVNLEFRNKHKIILNPNEETGVSEYLNNDIMLDRAKWKIPERISPLVEYLSKNSMLSNEDKILMIYDVLCRNYVYDDNILSYLKKIEEDDDRDDRDDIYALPDWYAREVGTDWEENRESHNRRACYEVSRYLAESLRTMFKDDNKYDTCIFWNKNLTHYFVGLTCDDYSVALDLDNFFNIKDLTRLKTGLTAEGIKVLDDKKGKFKKALDKFNEGRSVHSITKIEAEIENRNKNGEISNDEDFDDITFLNNAIEILKEDSDLDSQGLFEYMKEIVDIKLGSKARRKVWKKLEGTSKENTRYIRCLLLGSKGKKYIIDVDEKQIMPFDEEEFNKENSVFIPYKELSRDWDDRYDGT